MPAAQRLSILAPLPPEGEWHRALALDWGAGPPRKVVLSFAPAGLLDDAERLAALIRDVEAAGRLHHPGAVPVLGTETLDDRLAVVEHFRPGTTVRALVDAAGRLPPDVSARIVVDACAAVARAHAIDAGEGRMLVHGGLTASRILVGEDGAALVSGFGAGGGGDPAADVSALAEVLFECLAGERPRDAASLLQVPGIPFAMAEAVVRALREVGAFPTAAAFAQAIAGAGPLASHGDVAAYAEIARPPPEDAPPAGPAQRGLTEEIAAELIVEATDPGSVAPPPPPDPAAGGPLGAAAAAQLGSFVEPTFEPLPRPPATRPGSDPAGVFAAPRPPAAPARLPVAIVTMCLLVGFGAGFAAARTRVPRRPPQAAAEQRAAQVPPAAPGVDEAPGSEPEAAPPPRPARPARASAATRRSKAQAAKAAKTARTAARPVADAPAAKGFLDVTAPAGAEVFLDGRRIGIGGLRVEIPVGRHHIEVRLGEAKVEEAFDLGPAETWTYAVTPTN